MTVDIELHVFCIRCKENEMEKVVNNPEIFSLNLSERYECSKCGNEILIEL